MQYAVDHATAAHRMENAPVLAMVRVYWYETARKGSTCHELRIEAYTLYHEDDIRVRVRDAQGHIVSPYLDSFPHASKAQTDKLRIYVEAFEDGVRAAKNLHSEILPSL